MPSVLKVGISQSHTRLDLSSTLAVLRSQSQKAAEESISILLFPEAFLGGYPRTCTFGASIGARDPAGRDQYLEYLKAAVDLGDTFEGAGDAWANKTLPTDSKKGYRGDGTREVIEAVAHETGVFLVIGLVERSGSSLFCSAVFVHPDDGMIAKRRKVQPTGTERLVWAQGSPATLKAVSTVIMGVKVVMGSAICWENYMPLLRYALYAQGVNLWLAPTADGRDGWASLMRVIGQEGRCFVLSANQCQKQSDIPEWASWSSSTLSSNSKSTPSTTQITTNNNQEDQLTTPETTIVNGDTNPAGNPLGRRKSIATKTSDGTHEIAWRPSLPSSSTEPPHSPQNPSSHITNTQDPPSPPSKSLPTTVEYASRGGSLISSPLGDILAGPIWEEQDAIIASLVDFDDCARGKLDFDVSGHYARADVFKLKVEGLDLNPPA